MEGSYDLSLVALSYLVAILASYCALYFSTQLTQISGRKRNLWLFTGAVSMGLGIWSMHFIGMGAYRMHMPMSYDLTMTLVSCVAAILSSGLALYLISRPGTGWLLLLPGSLVMGAGIALMHYLGMAAMRMTPAPTYDPLWFSISLVIAVGASGAAMAICRYTQTLSGRRAVVFQGVAALVMGAAICGMHYTGMAAVILPQGSIPAVTNQLTETALGIPSVSAAVAFIVVSLITVYADLKGRLAEEERQRQEEEWVQSKTFTDEATGLPNRARFERYLLNSLVGEQSSVPPFSVLMLEVSNYRDLAAVDAHAAVDLKMQALAEKLSALVPAGSFLARYSNSTFGLVLHGERDEAQVQQLMALLADIQVSGWAVRWKAGISGYPQTAQSSRMLIREALKTRPLTDTLAAAEAALV